MKSIGIDYGTTTSWIAINNKEKTEVESMMSACNILHETNRVVYGVEAYNSRHNGQFVRSPKSYISRLDWDGFLYKYRFGLNAIVEEFSEKLITRGLKEFDDLVDEEVHVTVTIPNCYDGSQMRYIYDCFRKILSEKFANFKLYLLPEPIAAALFYLCQENKVMNMNCEHVLVCDMGGGTTDIALIRFERKQDRVVFEVMATVSDASLGGDALDDVLYSNVLSSIGIDERRLRDPYEMMHKVVEAKRILSTRKYYDIEVETNVGNGLSRQTMCAEQIKKCFDWDSDVCNLGKRFRDCMLKIKDKVPRNFDWKRVILLPVGGSMKIPALRTLLKDFFSGQLYEMRRADQGTSYDSVVLGAMYYSAIRSESYPRLNRVDVVGRTRFPVSIETINGRLTSIVSANMPDDEYTCDKLRPLEIDENGNFSIEQLRFYYSDAPSVRESKGAPFVIEVGEKFKANGRAAEDIVIEVTLKIKDSMPKTVRLRMENVCDNGDDYVNEFDLE